MLAWRGRQAADGELEIEKESRQMLVEENSTPVTTRTSESAEKLNVASIHRAGASPGSNDTASNIGTTMPCGGIPHLLCIAGTDGAGSLRARWVVLAD